MDVELNSNKNFSAAKFRSVLSEIAYIFFHIYAAEAEKLCRKTAELSKYRRRVIAFSGICGIIIICADYSQKNRNEVTQMTDNTISFIAERKHYTIPVNDILYVIMKKQDAYVHLSNGRVLKTRKTFAEFLEELGDDFIRIHRGGIVAAKAIHSVNTLITLSNGDSLEYSAQHREEIMQKFRKKQRIIIDEIMDNDNPTENEEYHKHYQCFDTIPIAFTDIEMVFDEESQAVDWIFRYGNEALARLEECTLDEMIGNTFRSIFPNMDNKWLRSY